MTDLQNELLIFYKKLKKILDSNNIKYFAIGGTAIGALRHKGFIPWDDDMDFCIFEKDIEKFRKVINDSEFSFCPLNKKGKLMKREDTRYFYKVFDHKIDVLSQSIQKSISIDFMVAQKEKKWTPYKRMAFNFYWQLSMVKRRTWKEFRMTAPFLFVLGNFIFRSLFFFMNRKWIRKRMDSVLHKGKKIDNDDSIYYTYHFVKNEYYDLGEIEKVNFENTYVPVSKKFPEDFGRLYGDIFKLPPKENRVNKHLTELIKKEK